MKDLVFCCMGRNRLRKKKPTVYHEPDVDYEPAPVERVLKWIPSSILGRRSGSSEIMKLGEELRKVIAASRYQDQDYNTERPRRGRSGTNGTELEMTPQVYRIRQTFVHAENNPVLNKQKAFSTVEVNKLTIPPRKDSLRGESLPNLLLQRQEPNISKTTRREDSALGPFSKSTATLNENTNTEEVRSYPIRGGQPKFRPSQLGLVSMGNSLAGSTTDLGSPEPRAVLSRESFNTLDYRSYVPNEVFRDISRLVRESMSTISAFTAWSTTDQSPPDTCRARPERSPRPASRETFREKAGPRKSLDKQEVQRKVSSVYTAQACSAVSSVASLPIRETYAAALSPAPTDSTQKFTMRGLRNQTGSFKWKKASMKIKRGLTRERIEAFERGLASTPAQTPTAADENHLPNCVGISSPLREIAVPPGSPSPVEPSNFSKVRQSVRSWETNASSSNTGSRRMLIRPRYSNDGVGVVKLRTQNSRMRIKKHFSSKELNDSQAYRPSMQKSRSMVLRSNFTKSMSRLRQRLSLSVIPRDSAELQNDQQKYEGLQDDDTLQGSGSDPRISLSDRLTLNYSIEAFGDLDLARYCGPEILNRPPPIPRRFRSKYSTRTNTTDAPTTSHG